MKIATATWLKLSFLLLAWILVSCNAGKTAKMKEILKGDWSLEAATRNGVETGTLDNLFLEFDNEGGKVRTNLSGSTEDYTYVLEDNVLNLGEGKLLLEVESADDSLLVVQLNIENTPFKLWFTR